MSLHPLSWSCAGRSQPPGTAVDGSGSLVAVVPAAPALDEAPAVAPGTVVGEDSVVVAPAPDAASVVEVEPPAGADPAADSPFVPSVNLAASAATVDSGVVARPVDVVE